MNYKPFANEHLDMAAEGLRAGLEEYRTTLLEQIRRANDLALSLLAGNPYTLSDEQKALLHDYLGEPPP